MIEFQNIIEFGDTTAKQSAGPVEVAAGSIQIVKVYGRQESAAKAYLPKT
jgi:hypothetical protein